MKRQLTIAKLGFAPLLSTLLLAACHSQEKRMASTPKLDTVQIKQMKFQPAELTVRKGDTVLFVNNDMVAHDVTEETKKAWASGPMQPGSSWKLVSADDADYYCSIHVVMKGKIKLAK